MAVVGHFGKKPSKNIQNPPTRCWRQFSPKVGQAGGHSLGILYSDYFPLTLKAQAMAKVAPVWLGLEPGQVNRLVPSFSLARPRLDTEPGTRPGLFGQLYIKGFSAMT